MSNLYLFDCFGVVVSDVSQLWMEKHFTQEQQKHIRAEVFRKVDCGQLSFRRSMEILAEMAGISTQQTLREWDDCLHLTNGIKQVLDDLRQQGNTVALLSNASNEYVDFLFSRYDLHKHFDKLFVSSYYGCAKPDKEFYSVALNGFSQKFDAIFFTDDNPDFLVGLEELGITPVLFVGLENLKKRYGLN
ncbi:MAG: HAD family hydrolase [Candidatus Fimimonas sp.]